MTNLRLIHKFGIDTILDLEHKTAYAPKYNRVLEEAEKQNLCMQEREELNEGYMNFVEELRGQGFTINFYAPEEKAPPYSPDGTKITFVSARDGNICTMNPDGSNQRILTGDIKYKGIDGKEYTSFEDLERAHETFCKKNRIKDDTPEFLVVKESIDDKFFVGTKPIHDTMPVSYPIWDATGELVHVLPGTTTDVCIGFKVELDKSGKKREIPVYKTYSNPLSVKGE